MSNPTDISQHKFNSPIIRKHKQERKKTKNGNLPYLRFRRKMRKSMFA